MVENVLFLFELELVGVLEEELEVRLDEFKEILVGDLEGVYEMFV